MKCKTLFQRLLLLALAVLVGVSFVGCDGNDANGDESVETEAPVTEYLGHFAPPTPSDQDLSAGEFFLADDLIDTDGYMKDGGGYVYMNVTSQYFDIGGITHPNDNNGEYYRLDANNKAAYPEDLANLAEHTSGVTVRFRTNADSISLNVTMRNTEAATWPHFSTMGACGLTVYVGSGTDLERVGSGYICNTDRISGYEIALPSGYKEVTIVLPIYSGISFMSVGIPYEAKLAKPLERTYGDIVFYGSSITQGAAVSHPGLSYSNIVTRMLDADCRNLGFSGGCRGEQVMCDYIASLDMAAFVLDYDWNASTTTHLQQTHYNVYETVRKAHPDIPIIMMSRPIFNDESDPDQELRQAIIESSYNKAVEAGDTNVYFISGADFYDFEMPDLCAMDFIHPNDLGHYYMAKAVYEVLKPALDAAE